MALTPITVQGTYKKPDGSAASGIVRFNLVEPILDGAGNTIVATHEMTATLDGSGAFSTTLYATDGTGLLPVGNAYEVEELISGVKRRRYEVAIPSTPTTINLADYIPTTSRPVYEIEGPAGREVELQTSLTHIQWRYVGDVSWTDLVPLTSITGPPGGYTKGQIEAFVGALLVEGANINLTFNAGTPSLVIDVVGLETADLSDFASAVTTAVNAGVAVETAARIAADAAHEADTTNVHGITDTATLYRQGGTDVAVADGGSGASTAPDALTNLAAATGSSGGRMLSPTAHKALATLHQAYADRTTAPIKSLWIGDSQVAFGFINRQVNTAVADVLNAPNRPLSVFNASGTICPGDFIFGVGATAAVWTSTTGVVPADKVANRGISGEAIALADNDDIISPSITCDQVVFKWLTPLSGSGATFDFYVDNVLAPADTARPASAAGSHTITVTPGAHTFKIVSHGVTLFDNIQVFYGNSALGWQPYSAGQSGVTTTNINAWSDLAGYITAINPAVTFIEGSSLNDYTTGDLTGATWYAQTLILIAAVRAASATSIVIVLPNALPGFIGWESFRKYARRIARERNVLLVDLGDTLPDLSLDGPGLPTVDSKGITSDGLHYSLRGRRMVQQGVMQGVFGGNSTPNHLTDMTPADLHFGLDRGMRRFITDFDEFDTTLTVGGVIPGTNFRVERNGTGSQAQQMGSDGNTANGAIGLSTGTLSTGWCASWAGVQPTGLSTSKGFDCYARIRIPILTTTGETFTVRVGALGTVDGVAKVNGVFFEALADGGNWDAVTVASGVETRTDTGVAPSTSYRNLTIRFDPDTDTAYFYSGTSLVATHTTNIPLSIALPIFPGMEIKKVTGTTARLVHFDLFVAHVPDGRTLINLVP